MQTWNYIGDETRPAHPLVNRVRELSELHAGVDQALRGHGQIFTISGEPGIGKSRLAKEAAHYCQSKGGLVLWGRCWEGGGAPAYWPWVQIVRGLANISEPSTLAESMGSGAAEIAQIVPELHNHFHELTGLPDSKLADPEQVRFRLFDSMVSFLSRSAATQALQIVLEDLHAADPTSLLLLVALAKHVHGTRLIVIGSYREVEIRQSPEHAALIAETEREGMALHLRGLGHQDVGEFIQQTSGIRASAPLVSRLEKTTAGNPFFLGEILRSMAAEGQLTTISETTERDQLKIPDGVRESIKKRITPLAPETRGVLTIAAVIGHEFDIRILQRASGLSGEELMRHLDPATELELVTELKGVPARYSFRHALIQETVYETLPTAQRRKLHSIVGDAIRTSYSAENHCAEIAHHYSKAIPMGDPSLAVEYSRLAAHHSRKQLAFEEESRHLRMALETVPLIRDETDLLRAELLFELGQAENRSGDLAAGQKTLLQSAELARSLNKSELFARAVVEAGRRVSDSGTTNRTLVALLREASERLGDTDSPVLAQVLARLGVELYWSERSEGVALCQQALAMAHSLGDPHTSIIALWAHHLSLRNPDSLEQRLSDTAEVIQLAEMAGEKDFALEARFYRIADLLEAGNIAEADLECAQYFLTETELRDRFKRGLLLQCMRAHLDGRLDEAEQLAQDALAAGQASRRPLAVNSFMIHKGMNLWERGRMRDMEPQLRGFIAQNPLIVFARCALLLCFTEDGRYSEAQLELENFAKNDFGAIPRDWNWIPAMFVLADVCADLADAHLAATLYRLLSPYALRNAMLGNVYSFGSVNYELGRLALVNDRFDDAEMHFEAALAANRHLRATLWTAHTQQQYASLCAKRSMRDDQEKATELFRSAYETAETLGIGRLQRKLVGLLPQAPPPITIPDEPAKERRVIPDSTPVEAWDSSAKRDQGFTLVTVLFVDIVGSTKLALELGNQRWRDLLGTFDTTVRQQFRLSNGREIDNPGDGFLAFFERPADGIRAGWSIIDAVEPLGLNVRVGLHTGECEWIGKKAVGIAIHIGARVAAEAEPGEVMVSSTVRDLLVGSPITFQDRGWHSLKGIADKWRLFRAEKASG